MAAIGSSATTGSPLATRNASLHTTTQCSSPQTRTFSAAPTSYTSDKIASIIGNEQFAQYTINYMYNICGLQDNIAYASASAAAKNLPNYTDKLVAGENFMWQEKAGNHDFSIWYLGFYNFAQLAFKTAE